MPYWLESDTFADDPVWEVLAEGNLDQLDRLQSAYARLKSKASHLKTDGYLTEQTALRYARNRRQLLDRLAISVLDRPPLLHRPGDECECLGDARWIEGYAFRIHQFLYRNPSKREYERNRAQRADLKDPRLKQMVYERDGGCCRYCRSGPLSPKAGRSRDRRKVLVYDHVDPDAPAGPDGSNLVTSCGRCNEHKGKRTPDEADMALLPVPTPAEAAAWRARGLALHDPADHRPISAGSPLDQRSDADPDQNPDGDPIGDPERDPDDSARPAVYPPTSEQSTDQGRPWSGKGPGAGRGGDRADPSSLARPPVQPTRPASTPDVYHRRSRYSPPLPPPEFHWPPQSVPATPRPTEHTQTEGDPDAHA